MEAIRLGNGDLRSCEKIRVANSQIGLLVDDGLYRPMQALFILGIVVSINSTDHSRTVYR